MDQIAKFAPFALAAIAALGAWPMILRWVRVLRLRLDSPPAQALERADTPQPERGVLLDAERELAIHGFEFRAALAHDYGGSGGAREVWSWSFYAPIIGIFADVRAALELPEAERILVTLRTFLDDASCWDTVTPADASTLPRTARHQVRISAQKDVGERIQEHFDWVQAFQPRAAHLDLFPEDYAELMRELERESLGICVATGLTRRRRDGSFGYSRSAAWEMARQRVTTVPPELLVPGEDEFEGKSARRRGYQLGWVVKTAIILVVLALLGIVAMAGYLELHGRSELAAAQTAAAEVGLSETPLAPPPAEAPATAPDATPLYAVLSERFSTPEGRELLSLISAPAAGANRPAPEAALAEQLARAPLVQIVRDARRAAALPVCRGGAVRGWRAGVESALKLHLDLATTLTRVGQVGEATREIDALFHMFRQLDFAADLRIRSLRWVALQAAFQTLAALGADQVLTEADAASLSSLVPAAKELEPGLRAWIDGQLVETVAAVKPLVFAWNPARNPARSDAFRARIAARLSPLSDFISYVPKEREPDFLFVSPLLRAGSQRASRLTPALGVSAVQILRNAALAKIALEGWLQRARHGALPETIDALAAAAPVKDPITGSAFQIWREESSLVLGLPPAANRLDAAAPCRWVLARDPAKTP